MQLKSLGLVFSGRLVNEAFYKDFRNRAVRRPMVEALTFRLASCARKAATVAGDAGSISSSRSSHHPRKIRKSVP